MNRAAGWLILSEFVNVSKGHLAVSCSDLANQSRFFPLVAEHSYRQFRLIGGTNQDEADAHVESAEHFLARHIASRL